MPPPGVPPPAYFRSILQQPLHSGRDFTDFDLKVPPALSAVDAPTTVAMVTQAARWRASY